MQILKHLTLILFLCFISTACTEQRQPETGRPGMEIPQAEQGEPGMGLAEVESEESHPDRILSGTAQSESGTKHHLPEAGISSDGVEHAAAESETRLQLAGDEHETLKAWMDFYKAEDPSFTLENFEFSSSSDLNKMESNIHGIFDDEFDDIYTDFLIWHPDGEKYIDIDSYLWSPDRENRGELMFEADQEISVVNIPDRSISRIAFRGPSFRVEDAFWKSDSLLIFLENTYENVPVISKVNLRTERISAFFYSDTLRADVRYSDQRIQHKLAE